MRCASKPAGSDHLELQCASRVPGLVHVEARLGPPLPTLVSRRSMSDCTLMTTYNPYTLLLYTSI